MAQNRLKEIDLGQTSLAPQKKASADFPTSACSAVDLKP